MSDELPSEEPDENLSDSDDSIPVIEEGMETLDLADSVEVEELDPLEEALLRAEKAEKEIAYKDAEIQNVRKRLMAEKSELIQYSGMGLARRMLTVLGEPMHWSHRDLHCSYASLQHRKSRHHSQPSLLKRFPASMWPFPCCQRPWRAVRSWALIRWRASGHQWRWVARHLSAACVQASWLAARLWWPCRLEHLQRRTARHWSRSWSCWLHCWRA